MGGIVGYITNKPKMNVVKAMADRISYRGPKCAQYYIDDNIALGYRKLNNSLYEDDKLVVVLTGSIYNDLELKKKVSKKYKFKTNSASELLACLYNEYNHEIPEMIQGAFSFVIYDKEEKKVFCAIDKWGNKPFYYYKNNDVFMFGSETKCFLDHPMFNKELNAKLLVPYLCFNSVPTRETFLNCVFRLEPGHKLIYKNNEIKIEKYFEIDFDEKRDSFDKSVKELETAMKNSIKLQRITDKNVGSFLSSGVDSSYIVSLAKPKYTFTAGFEDKRYNEDEYAKDLASNLGIINKTRVIKKEEYIKEFPHIQYIMDEPLANPSAVAIYFGAEAASKYVNVITSGEGADELFGGYFNYREDIDHAWYLKIPYPIRKVFALIGSIAPEKRGFNFIYRKGTPLSKYNIGVGRVFQDKEALKIVKDKNQMTCEEIIKPYYERYKNNSNMVQRQMIDYYFWLVRDFLHCVDRDISAFGMEARTPFLTEEVYEVARHLKNEDKVNNSTTKVLLRQAAKSAIPNESYKKKKLGFPVPLREWIREDELYNTIKEKFSSDIASKFFDTDKILKLLERHRNRKEDTYKKVWAIYSFIIWYEEFFTK